MALLIVALGFIWFAFLASVIIPDQIQQAKDRPQEDAEAAAYFAASKIQRAQEARDQLEAMKSWWPPKNTNPATLPAGSLSPAPLR
jgi:hypothetical protein